MALSSAASRVDYTGTGSTLTYSYPFKCFVNTDLLVTVQVIATGVETTLTLTTHYTVTGVGESSGGNVVLVNGAFAWISGGFLASTYKITIRRVRPFTQAVSMRNQGDFYKGTIEDTFDKVTMLCQQLDNDVDRSVKLPETVSPSDVSVTLPFPTANQGFRWNSSATALENYSVASSGSISLPGSNGIAVYSGSSVFTVRTLTAGSAISVTNGDGQSGNPTVAVDINGTTALTSPDTADSILVYDASAAANRKVTLTNMVTGFTALTAPATDDELLTYDTSTSAVKKITNSDFLKVVNSLTEDTAPVAASDFILTYDTSASGVKKTLAKRVGAVLQAVNTTTTAVATGTTQLPWDDTIPQNTEGTEFMTLAITPKSATSKLQIDVVVQVAINTADTASIALFQDSTANALAAMATHIDANDAVFNVKFTHFMTSGTTSATTFKVRAGPNGANTLTFNGSAGGRKFGGVISSTITITEIEV